MQSLHQCRSGSKIVLPHIHPSSFQQKTLYQTVQFRLVCSCCFLLHALNFWLSGRLEGGPVEARKAETYLSDLLCIFNFRLLNSNFIASDNFIVEVFNCAFSISDLWHFNKTKAFRFATNFINDQIARLNFAKCCKYSF